MCPHTTAILLSYYYICVLILIVFDENGLDWYVSIRTTVPRATPTQMPFVFLTGTTHTNADV